MKNIVASRETGKIDLNTSFLFSCSFPKPHKFFHSIKKSRTENTTKKEIALTATSVIIVTFF